MARNLENIKKRNSTSLKEVLPIFYTILLVFLYACVYACMCMFCISMDSLILILKKSQDIDYVDLLIFKK